MQVDLFSPEITSLIRQFIERQKRALLSCEQLYYPDYIDGFNYLFGNGFSPEDLWRKLATVGWKPRMVDGYLSGYAYFQHLRRKEIPINVHIRPEGEIDFARFPDTIHDVMGHCPMLFSKQYMELVYEITDFVCSVTLEERDFEYLALHQSSLEKRQKVASLIESAEEELKKTPTPYYYHTRMALWTMEFGLIQAGDVTHAYGAALVGSPMEMENIKSGKMPIVQLTPWSLETHLNISDLQDCLYASADFEQIKEVIMSFPAVGQTI